MKKLIQSINPSYDQDPQGNKPTVLECAMFCRLVYSTTSESQEQLRKYKSDWYLSSDELVVGVSVGAAAASWSLFHSESQKLRIGVFIHEVRKIVVIAIKGTELTDISDLKSDSDIFLGKKSSLIADTVQPFVEKQINTRGKSYHVFLAGHSLGGALAEHLSLLLKIPCVSFESPGEHFKDAGKENFIQAYLSKPNFINCAGFHIGQVRRLNLQFPPMSASELVSSAAKGGLKDLLWENRDVVIGALSKLIVFGLHAAKVPVSDSIEGKLTEYGGKAAALLERKASDPATERVVNAFRETLKFHCLDNIIYSLILMTGPGELDPENLQVVSSWPNLRDHLFELGIMKQNDEKLVSLQLNKRYYLNFLRSVFSPEVFEAVQNTLDSYLFNLVNSTPDEVLETFSKHQTICIVGFAMAIRQHRIDSGAVAAAEMLCAEYEILAKRHDKNPALLKISDYQETLRCYLALQKQAEYFFFGTDIEEPSKSTSLPPSPLLPEAMCWPSALQYLPVPPDGSCLYHAVALYLGQDQSALRRHVSDYLEQHKDEFRAFITPTEGKSLEDYIIAVQRDHEWATEVEIQILMKVYDRPIIIIGPDQVVYNPSVLEKKGEPIFVYFNGRDHYDALIRVGSASGAEILKKLSQLQKANAKEAKEFVAKSSSTEAQACPEFLAFRRVKFPADDPSSPVGALKKDIITVKRRVEKRSSNKAKIAGSVSGVLIAAAITGATFGTGAAPGAAAGASAGGGIAAIILSILLGAVIDFSQQYEEIIEDTVQLSSEHADNAAAAPDLIAAAGTFVSKKGYESAARFACVASLVSAYVAMGMKSGRASKEEILRDVAREVGIRNEKFSDKSRGVEAFIARALKQAENGALKSLLDVLAQSKQAQNSEKDANTFTQTKKIFEILKACQENADLFHAEAAQLVEQTKGATCQAVLYEKDNFEEQVKKLEIDLQKLLAEKSDIQVQAEALEVSLQESIAERSYIQEQTEANLKLIDFIADRNIVHIFTPEKRKEFVNKVDHTKIDRTTEALQKIKANYEDFMMRIYHIEQPIEEVKAELQRLNEVLESRNMAYSSNIIPTELIGEIQKAIGSGTFGEVHVAKWIFKNQFPHLKPHNQLAVKCFKGEVDRMKLIEETRKFRSLATRPDYSPFLIRILGVTDVLHRSAICMEYLAGGTLSLRLYKNEMSLALSTKLRWGIEIGLGLNYLHRNGIYHEDLRSANVGLTRGDDNATAKLIDFGFSNLSQEAQSTHSQNTQELSGGVLTPQPWLAPERSLDEDGHMPAATSASDVYSYAMVLYELMTRSEPFFEVLQKDKIFAQGAEVRPPLSEGEFAKLDSKLLARASKAKAEGKSSAKIAELLTIFSIAKAQAAESPEDFKKIIKGGWSSNPDDRPSAADLSESVSRCYAASSRHDLSFFRTPPSVQEFVMPANVKEQPDEVQILFKAFFTLFYAIEALKKMPHEKKDSIQLAFLEQNLNSIGIMLLSVTEIGVPKPEEGEKYTFDISDDKKSHCVIS